MISPTATICEQDILLVDGHVHLHDCFKLADFLKAALSNFQTQSQQLKVNSPIAGALLLAEVSGVNAFSQLSAPQRRLESPLEPPLSEWEIHPTQEAFSVWAKHAAGHSILITAGRQVVTSEGIEVLALITDAVIEDGRSLEETLVAVEQSEGLPVLPWGVGKWIGKRGKLVQAQLQSDQRDLLFAGDNGGRPGFWTLPHYFHQRPQIPGSDPLPLPAEVTRAGSFGFMTKGKLDSNRPGASLRHILRQTQPFIQPYGRSRAPFEFIKSQSLLRMK